LWTGAEGIEHENHFKDRPEHPAENMDWRQAVAYCDWLTRVKSEELPEGSSLACLPTEAEWEHACRAGTDTEYYSGDGDAALAEVGWYGENSGWETHPVGRKRPNAFGLFDMHGNVWEWCHDVWDESSYRRHADGATDPGREQRLTDWRAGLEGMTASDQARVLRGGSWDDTAVYCRSSIRVGGGPDDRAGRHGFRVCLVRGPAAGRGARRTGAAAEPGAGDGGRGTRPESEAAGGAGAVGVPDLAGAKLPRVPGTKGGTGGSPVSDRT